MTEHEGREARETRVPVTDRRRVGRPAGEGAPEPPVQESPGDVASDVAASSDVHAVAPEPGTDEGLPEAAELLADLQRLQADFDNYRKRMLREQTAMAQRASARLVERLLPVLDNFERAIAHGEAGEGIQLVYKDLRKTLEDEGLEEIAAEGEPFDPNVHEAVESREDADAEQTIVTAVYRRGYLLNGQVLRPAMVVVARPAESASAQG